MHAEQFQLHAEIEEKHWWFLARRQIMQRLLAASVKKEQGSRPLIVDVGCGTGANIASLTNDYRCVGIDTSEVGISLATQRFPQVKFLCGHAPDALGDLAKEADAWLIMDVLEHIKDDFAVLSALLHSMKPGAQIFITVPAHLHLWSTHDESFGHYRRYDHMRLRAVWADLPVTERLLSYYNTHLYPIVWAIRAFNRWRGTSPGTEQTDFDQPSPIVNRTLQTIFASESKRLLDHLDQPGPHSWAYPTGVSLVAILERNHGEVLPRTKPPQFAHDHYNPGAR